MPSLKDIFVVFLKMGTFAIGGVYSMLTFFQREIVEKRGWLTLDEFAEGVAVGQITPGPPIVNTGVFIGYKLRGPKGALAATAGQVLPGFFIVLALAYVYRRFRDTPAFAAILKGIGAAVVGLIVSVIYRMARQLVRNRAAALLAGSGFILLYFLEVNPIFLIALAGGAGYLFYGRRK